ncbi:MAG: sulfatase [Candidatus Latescibacteria bacterium]|jgi:choline-sulfatase|nr:sulfatase [Candidatus Latescibacterota bacterium]
MRIIYFDIDSLRPDHLGCYGYDRPTSPTIDRLAKEGTRFTHYYCSDSPCMPSRHALISGRFGINNGVVTHGGAASKPVVDERLYGGPKPHNQLLQRVMRENGYDTVCFSNFAYRHCATWFGMGWSEFHSPSLGAGNESAEEVNETVLRWVNNYGDRDDYFLYINYWDPHRIYTVDESWAERFDDYPVTQNWPDEAAIEQHGAMDGPFTAFGQFPDNKSRTPLMPGAVTNRKDFEQMVTGYDASIAYTDSQIQRVLDALEAQGVLDDTAIIISADHGDNFGEHGIYSDHVCADEAIHNVPLIVRWPGVSEPGHVCDSLLYNVDLSAGLCELTGGQAPEWYDGQSLAGFVRAEQPFDRDYLVWGHGLYTLQRAVRTKEHLMVRTYDNYGYEFDPVELYNMKTDRFQTHNLRDEDPACLAKMDHLLNEWLYAQSQKPYAIPDPMQVVLQERQAR